MEVSKIFLDIIMKPQYTPLKEICMMVRGLPYLIRIPNIDKPINVLGELNTKIRYKLDHPSPQKRGRPSKYHYKDLQEANHFYYEAFKAKRLAKSSA